MAADKSPCKTIAFTAGFEGELKLLDCASGRIRRLDVGQVAAAHLAYSRTRNLLAFDEKEGHGASGSLYLLDLKTLKVEHIYSGEPSLYGPQFDHVKRCQVLTLDNFAATASTRTDVDMSTSIMKKLTAAGGPDGIRVRSTRGLRNTRDFDSNSKTGGSV